MTKTSYFLTCQKCGGSKPGKPRSLKIGGLEPKYTPMLAGNGTSKFLSCTGAFGGMFTQLVRVESSKSSCSVKQQHKGFQSKR